MTETKYLTRKEMAALLRKHVRTIDRYRKEGKLSYIKLNGSYLYPTEQPGLKPKREGS